MILMIMEDGVIICSESYTDDELQSCNDGWMDMIDISDSLQPLSYQNGSWVAVEHVSPDDY